MGHSMILLNDGSILIAGGSKDSFEDFGKTSTFPRKNIENYIG